MEILSKFSDSPLSKINMRKIVREKIDNFFPNTFISKGGSIFSTCYLSLQCRVSIGSVTTDVPHLHPGLQDGCAFGWYPEHHWIKGSGFHGCVLQCTPAPSHEIRACLSI